MFFFQNLALFVACKEFCKWIIDSSNFIHLPLVWFNLSLPKHLLTRFGSFYLRIYKIDNWEKSLLSIVVLILHAVQKQNSLSSDVIFITNLYKHKSTTTDRYNAYITPMFKTIMKSIEETFLLSKC